MGRGMVRIQGRAHPMGVDNDKLNGRLRLSVLDQSPVPAGSTPGQALKNSIELARLVDGLGYTRFWMSEHHAMDTLACTAPEVMLARIGAETERIRIGAGGIMLPHYTPLKVAECFRTLHALYPGRVDSELAVHPGVGRSRRWRLSGSERQRCWMTFRSK